MRHALAAFRLRADCIALECILAVSGPMVSTSIAETLVLSDNSAKARLNLHMRVDKVPAVRTSYSSVSQEMGLGRPMQMSSPISFKNCRLITGQRIKVGMYFSLRCSLAEPCWISLCRRDVPAKVFLPHIAETSETLELTAKICM
jgi:hypothetical protein